MRPVIDYSKDLRRKLADGKTLDQAFSELRSSGASIFDCIASIRTFRRCDLAEAKRIVESSKVWSDYRNATDEFVREFGQTDDQNAD